MPGYVKWRQIDLKNLQIRYATAIDSGVFSQNHRDIVDSIGTINIIVMSITKAIIRIGTTLRRDNFIASSIAISTEVW